MAASSSNRSPLKGKGGLIGILVLGLFIGLYVLDLKGPKPRDPGTQPPISDFMGLSSDRVRRVEVKRPTDGFVLARQGTAWSFEAPRRYRANPETVNTWLKGLLEDATVSRSVTGKAEGDATYGLDKPVAELVLTDDGGKAHTLRVGAEFKAGSVGGSYYARASEDHRLFLITTAQADDVRKKKVDELRDKRMSDLGGEESVQQITLERPEGRTTVRRGPAESWVLSEPFNAPADKINVESLISSLGAESERFVAEEATDLAKYGLDKPRLRARVKNGKGETVLLFGKSVKEGTTERVYFAREGESEVAQVTRFAFDAVNKNAGDLRDLRVVTLDRDKIVTLELRNGSGTVRLQRVGMPGSAQWQVLDGPSGKPERAKDDAAQRVVDAVTATASKHVEENPADLARYGLSTPAITVLASPGGGTSQAFILGKKGGNGYYAKGTGSAVFEVSTSTFDDLNVKREAFKDPTAKKPK